MVDQDPTDDVSLLSTLQAAERGSPAFNDAFAVLVKRYTRPLKSHIRIKGGVDSSSADDIVQQTFVGFLGYLEKVTIRPDEDLRRVLYGFSNNVLSKHLRTRSRVSYPRSFTDQGIDPDEIPDPSSEPKAVRSEERIGALHDEIKALPTIQRQIVLGRLDGGKTLEAIAAELNEPINTVRYQSSLATKALKSNLMEKQ
jgi:RNA polymerase sigma factor (sigma-70 family)